MEKESWPPYSNRLRPNVTPCHKPFSSSSSSSSSSNSYSASLMASTNSWPVEQDPPTLDMSFALESSASSTSGVSDHLFPRQFQPLLSNSHLKPGSRASLLPASDTLAMYRRNAARSSSSPSLQFDFAVFLVEVSQQEPDETVRRGYLHEALKFLKNLSYRGYADAQFYLAESYTMGIFKSGRPEMEKAFVLYVQAAKHGHVEASFMAARCYEYGLGTRRDAGKALQFYKKAAINNHPGALYRVAMAELHGELGRKRNTRDGIKWLKHAAEYATEEHPDALFELAQALESGVDDELYPDNEYALELYAQAVEELNHASSAFRLGECYEFALCGAEHDPELCLQYYFFAAQRGHPEACFALTAWYLVGLEGVLEQSDQAAYAWARQAADKGLAKAEYTLGYFNEKGIGVQPDEEAAQKFYRLAAEHGDKRALWRLRGEDLGKMKRNSNRLGRIVSFLFKMPSKSTYVA
ncbi:uncharacterized protein VTP21DRAFT_10563 [Calcarisporiella thermophila]|uniref:uncharacterized protein n=1 Tax=Calcarisporiella thermophila TaxID=911321 RepID=UPI003743C4FD